MYDGVLQTILRIDPYFWQQMHRLFINYASISILQGFPR